ncbi:MAG: hypothetical protein AB1649_03540 [Chloroflexota bacterium]
MQNKKTYFIMAIAIIVVAAAAFVGGRLLNGQTGPLGIFPMGNGGQMAISIEMIPAPELPKAEPATRGSFVERNDNTITLQTFSAEMGKGGVVMFQASGSDDGEEGPKVSSNMGDQGPKVEVVVTSETIIYRDATEMVEPSEMNETQTIQQAVEEGTLDDLTSDSMVMVWGRKNGDRVIAEVIMYSQPVIFKRPAP